MLMCIANTCTFLYWAFDSGVRLFGWLCRELYAQKTGLVQFGSMVLAWVMIITVVFPAFTSPTDALIRLIEGFDLVIFGLMCYEGTMRILIGPEYESRRRI